MPGNIDFADFAAGYNQFVVNVYKELIKSTTGNLLVCPLSADIILALVHAGAGGETAEQLSNALHLPKSPEKIKQAFRDLCSLLQHDTDYTFSSANKVYVKEGCEIIDTFKKTAVEDFYAEIQNINFAASQEAAATINKWVEEKTHDKIRNIVNPTQINDDIYAILVNALYFHGLWSKKFKRTLTSKNPFYLSNEVQVDVDMMTQTNYLEYCEDSELNAKFLMLDYKGGDVTMTFILPNEKDGLGTLEANILDVLKVSNYGNQNVHAEIPKFKIEAEIKFVPILEALGVVDAFSKKANFSGILASQPLQISKVLQKAFIDVNEEGTTAAAATKIELMKKKGRRASEPVDFIADHPFMFTLQINGIVFFLGRCVAPKY